MKLIIDIPEKRYKDIQRIAEVQIESNHFQTAEQIIAKGTPLPKGHGRLIDADELKANIYMYHRNRYCTQKDVDTSFYVINNAPTIIEADKGDKE